MSWGDYIKNALMNKQDAANGHIYNDCLTEAAIIGLDGNEWAKTGVTVSKDETNKLVELFKSTPGTYAAVTLGGKKYQITHYEQDNVAYLKIKDGGATVAKTNKAFIIGIYNTTKKFKQDGKELPQSVGMCNTVVEDLAAQLKGQGY